MEEEEEEEVISSFYLYVYYCFYIQIIKKYIGEYRNFAHIEGKIHIKNGQITRLNDWFQTTSTHK